MHRMIYSAGSDFYYSLRIWIQNITEKCSQEIESSEGHDCADGKPQKFKNRRQGSLNFSFEVESEFREEDQRLPITVI